MPQVQKENIGWIDLLRVIACFMVIVSHCSDGFIAQFDSNRESFLTGVFAGSLMRPCVPLFVMMTGVLLLPVKTTTSLSVFYRKRIGRILTPMVFWSLILPLLAFIYFSYINPSTQNPLVDVAGYQDGSWTQRLYTFIFNFNFDTVPLWYLYMLIGLYLIMPIVSAWLSLASKRDLQTVLCLWGISLIIPYLKMLAPILGYQGNYGNMELFGGCDWNAYTTFYYFSGFIGYLVLAFYLVKYPLNWNWKKTLAISLPMFVVGYAITAFGYIMIQQQFPGNYAYLEIVWYFSGINVFMMTLPVFIIIKKTEMRSLPWLSKLASLSFGIYLCHYIFVFISYDVFDSQLPYLVRIATMAIATFAISYLIVKLMSLSDQTRRFIS